MRQRLREHNAGKVPHTAKFKPWIIRSATAFRDRSRAMAFERYLKSGSGRAFLRSRPKESFSAVLRRELPLPLETCGELLDHFVQAGVPRANPARRKALAAGRGRRSRRP